MLFTFFAVSLCCSHVFGASPSEWNKGVEKIRLLNAQKASESGKPRASDFELKGPGILESGKEMDVLFRRKLEENNKNKVVRGFERSVAEMGSIITSRAMNRNSAEWTYDGNLTGESQHYSFYDLKKKCDLKVMVEQIVEEYKGDESNDVTIWMINEMSKDLTVSFTLDTEKSQTDTTGRSHAYETSVSTTVGAEGFGVKAELSATVGHKAENEQKQTVTNKNTTSSTFDLTVNPSRAIKMMRYVKMKKITTRYETPCHLSGYIGIKLQGSGDNRWFLPVTELAKVLTDFVLDDDKPDTVLFKYPNTEVSSGFYFVKETPGFETKQLGEDFLRME